MSRPILASASLAAVLALAACSSNDDGTPVATADGQGEDVRPGENVENPGESDFNPDLEPTPPRSEPSGDDTRAIAGLWDATGGALEREDVLYVLIGEDGLYTEYDYQQDALGDGENCYVVIPLRLDLEIGVAEDGTFSTGDLRTFAATLSDPDTLAVTFEPDIAEAESRSWPRIGADVDLDSLLPCES